MAFGSPGSTRCRAGPVRSHGNENTQPECASLAPADTARGRGSRCGCVGGSGVHASTGPHRCRR
ncbi:hypothetical protein ACFPRL_22845 [Pseudoclavibacter helvolus]